MLIETERSTFRTWIEGKLTQTWHTRSLEVMIWERRNQVSFKTWERESLQSSVVLMTFRRERLNVLISRLESLISDPFHLWGVNVIDFHQIPSWLNASGGPDDYGRPEGRDVSWRKRDGGSGTWRGCCEKKKEYDLRINLNCQSSQIWHMEKLTQDET